MMNTAINMARLSCLIVMIATFPFDIDCTGCMQAPRWAWVPAVSGLDEGQQVGVDLIPMRGREAVGRKVDDDCLRELRWLYDRRDLAEARRDLAGGSPSGRRPTRKLC
jgi:hypothetical protein